jgi:hypothetical protein
LHLSDEVLRDGSCTVKGFAGALSARLAAAYAAKLAGTVVRQQRVSHFIDARSLEGLDVVARSLFARTVLMHGGRFATLEILVWSGAGGHEISTLAVILGETSRITANVGEFESSLLTAAPGVGSALRAASSIRETIRPSRR